MFRTSRSLLVCARRAGVSAQPRVASSVIRDGSDAIATQHCSCSSAETLMQYLRDAAAPRRGMSTDFPVLGADAASSQDKTIPEDGAGGEVSEEAFHRAADLTLGQLFSKMEAFAREHTGGQASVEMSQGALSITSEKGGGIQVRKDAKARLLQVSSPHNDDKAATADVGFQLASDPGKCRWKAAKGGGDLHKLLGDNLKDMTGAPVDLIPEPQLGYGPDPT